MNFKENSGHIKYIVLPMLLYFFISQTVVFFGGQMQADISVLNLVNGMVNLILLYFFFYRGYEAEQSRIQKQAGVKPSKKTTYLFCMVAGICSCLALNNWITLSGIFRVITTYEDVSERIYSGNSIIMTINIVVIAVLMEELLFRGLLYREIKEIFGKVTGGILSALLFGFFHGNFVQGLYAFIIGLILVYAYECYQSMRAPIIIHMSANIISLLVTKTALFQGMYNSMALLLLFTIISTLTAAICLVQMRVAVKSQVFTQGTKRNETGF